MSRYQYNSSDLVTPLELTDREQFLLKESKTFCIYPWIHLHAYPTGETYPCCHAEMKVGQVGNCRTHTIQEIWNSPAQRQLRLDMLNETPNSTCARCYEQETSGFFSGRKSANKHHGHHVKKIHDTDNTGAYDKFEMTYWDIRFSNLCNLSCRSCGHIFSSSWYQDQAKLAGEDWARKNKPLNIAGRNPRDMWEQLLPHMDYVEQIYFAGGEPLMMDEHYLILEELERREKFDVRLIYNTNFTQVKLKNRYVFEYWKKFKNVAVGASLDAMGPRAEYIRHGTDWFTVEENRHRMMATCPNVDFYISPTLSIMNAWHLPDFHRNWVERGLIRAQDLNVNILQDPAYYRIDAAPLQYKQRLRIKFEEHLEWLRPRDSLQRATVGFESAIKFMMESDNSHLLEKFRHKTAQLDQIRGEFLLRSIPELEALYYENTTR
jgi:radical SAM protein with 4Fe4S-binding SPASM domain